MLVTQYVCVCVVGCLNFLPLRHDPGTNPRDKQTSDMPSRRGGRGKWRGQTRTCTQRLSTRPWTNKSLWHFPPPDCLYSCPSENSAFHLTALAYTYKVVYQRFWLEFGWICCFLETYTHMCAHTHMHTVTSRFTGTESEMLGSQRL